MNILQYNMDKLNYNSGLVNRHKLRTSQVYIVNACIELCN